MLEGKRIAILAEEDFEDAELIEPMRAMKDAGARVVVVGSGSKQSYKGKHGTATIRVDTTADKVMAEDFDAIIVPGGYAPDRMRRHQSMLELVKGVFDAGGVVAMICHAGWVPISAGIVKGKRVTSFYAIADDVRNAGADRVDAEVVRDGNIITSRQPSDLGAFCREIIGALTESK